MSQAKQQSHGMTVKKKKAENVSSKQQTYTDDD